MAGISSKALAFGEPGNKEQTFQGQRFDDELDLNWVQFKWRNHDPQIGRFLQIDPLAEKYVHNSTYAFSENKVTTHVELEGLEASWFGYGQHVPQKEWNNFHQGLQESLDKGVKPQIVAGAVILSLFFPQIAGPILAAEIFGVPSPTRPTSMMSSLAGETAAVASEMSELESLATKARVFEAGGEIGIMDGAGTLAVDAKTGFFNANFTVGEQTGVLTGEVNISDNAISLINLELTNAKGGLGTISQQNSIGPESILKLQRELTDLFKAGGYQKAALEYSRSRPPGSPLPNRDYGEVPLYDNTKK